MYLDKYIEYKHDDSKNIVPSEKLAIGNWCEISLIYDALDMVLIEGIPNRRKKLVFLAGLGVFLSRFITASFLHGTVSYITQYRTG